MTEEEFWDLNPEEYWEWRVETARGKKEFESAMDGLMSNMVDEGLVSMGWSEESEEIVFFMTPDQKKLHDMMHPG